MNFMELKKNGVKSKDYCDDCYKHGDFTTKITKERMIEVSIPYLLKEKPGIDEDEARREMEAFFPTLKRWKKRLGQAWTDLTFLNR